MLLIYWMGVSLILIYLPYSQQRRFTIGLFIPLAMLAVQGLAQIRRLDTPQIRFWLATTSSVANVILVSLSVYAMTQYHPYLYFTRSEWNGLLYLRASGAPHALVLVSPDMGLYIPAWTGQRVIYGHPHETVDARARATETTAFFAGTLADPGVLLKPVDFIFVGPRERAIGSPRIPPNFVGVFADGDVTIYGKR